MDHTNSFYRFQTGVEGGEHAPEADAPIPGATYVDHAKRNFSIQVGASTQAVLQSNLDRIVSERDGVVALANSLLDPRTGKPNEHDANRHARLVAKVDGLTQSALYQQAVGDRQLAEEAADDGGASDLIDSLTRQYAQQQLAQQERADDERAARAGRRVRR